MKQKVIQNPQSLLALQTGGARTGDSTANYVWELYDSWRIGFQSKVALFKNPQGSQYDSVQRTLTHTNMVASGSIPNGKRFVCKALKVFYALDTLKDAAGILDIQKYLEQTILEFNYDGKEIQLQLPLSHILGLNLPFLANAWVDPELGYSFTSILRDTVKPYYPLPIQIDLPAQQYFNFNITSFHTPAQGNQNDRIRLSLHGHMESLN